MATSYGYGVACDCIMFLFKLLTILLCSMYIEVEGRAKKVKYVYQRDMSEHCRRRVMPSVFLGQHVVEANSQILHFSQLEVPYSCFISIRTESGGNVILVIQLDDQPSMCSDEDLQESPVKVFGMGETFGGYWGHLPDVILSTQTPLVEKFYTLKTTLKEDINEEIKMIPDESDYEKERIKMVEFVSTTPAPPHGDTQDYIRQMIPIVNITGRLVKSEGEAERVFDSIDNFDLFYNVKRKPGEKYISTMVPLVQFSVDDKGSGRRAGVEDANETANNTTPEPRFDFEYDLSDFAFDPRLVYPFSGRKPAVAGKRYRPSVNRRLKFKNKGRMFLAKSTTISRNEYETKLNNSWPFIQGLLNNLTAKNFETAEKESQFESEKFSALMQRVADWQHNYSAYLAHNLSQSGPLFLDKNQQINMSSEVLKTSTQPALYSYTPYYENMNRATIQEVTKEKLENKTETTHTLPNNMEISTRIIKVSAGLRSTLPRAFNSSINTNTVFKSTNGNISEVATKTKNNNSSTTSSQSTTKLKKTSIKSSLTTMASVTGPIANHASWENVVQVAPKMAGILNQTSNTTKTSEIERKSRSAGGSRRFKRRRPRRRKRSIQAIPIEPARPNNLTTSADVITTPEAMYNFVDMQDFAQLVELQDDDIQGHLPLRYMRRFVGVTMFDLCKDRQEHTTQHVLFFNTSRIVLALNNFTIMRMTVIATPARWLPFTGQRCNSNSLECQVAGKRVCVNKMTACDGVPNCGAMDIYDEDRLECGAHTGLQHNVYLAAFTFLAVLLTMLYTVHYWLKRCVPQVSEAFFIYTDGTENILYLDSIMRSPLDMDDNKELYNIPYLEVLNIDSNARPKKKNVVKKMFQYCCGKRKKFVDDLEMEEEDVMAYRPRGHMFSFPELEISHLTQGLTAEVAVQTGESLEMTQTDTNKESKNFADYFRVMKITPADRIRKESIDPRTGFRDIRIHHDSSAEEFDRRTLESSELSMLKFLRDAKLNFSGEWNSSLRSSIIGELHDRERELRNTLYDRSTMTVPNVLSADSIELPPPESLSDVLRRTPYELNLPLLDSSNTSSEPGPSLVPSSVQRRIRFNETLTTIPHEEHEEAMAHASNLAVPVDADQDSSGTGTGREFRRFWTSNKNKKEKSKQRKHLEMH